MGLLKKIGIILLKASEVIAGFAPIASMAYPNQAGTIQTISNDSAQIANIIQQVEAVGQTLSLPGAQKLQAATPLVAQIILQSSVLANHKIANPDLFKQGSQKVADGWADILNSLNESGISTTDKT